MSDQKLRDLERRWQESRVLEDEVHLIKERLKSCVITETELKTAAMMGSPAAKIILPQAPTLGAWSAGFLLSGNRFCEQAVIAGMSIIVDLIQHYDNADKIGEEALAACEAFTLDQGTAVQKRVTNSIEAVLRAADPPKTPELGNLFSALFCFCSWVISSPEEQVAFWTHEQGPLIADQDLQHQSWEAVKEVMIPRLLGHR